MFFFFFNDTATTEIYTLSYTTLFRSYDKQRESGLRDPQTRYELRITFDKCLLHMVEMLSEFEGMQLPAITIIDSLDNIEALDRKSTRLNSSHANISYAVFCLKKKDIHYLLF